MQRVPGKQRSHEKAFPEGPRHVFEHKKQKDAVNRVDQGIDDVHGPRINAEQLTVQHVGQPGNRMPVGHEID